jgi:hypothetical protein
MPTLLPKDERKRLVVKCITVITIMWLMIGSMLAYLVQPEFASLEFSARQLVLRDHNSLPAKVLRGELIPNELLYKDATGDLLIAFGISPIQITIQSLALFSMILPLILMPIGLLATFLWPFLEQVVNTVDHVNVDNKEGSSQTLPR